MVEVTVTPETAVVDPAVPVKADAAPATTPAAAAQRPDTVPEKFWDAAKGAVNTEALLKSYAELEKMRGAPATKSTADAPTGAPQGDLKLGEATPAQAADAVTKAGLDFDALSQEYMTSGKIGDESYAKLEAAGIPKAVVDSYIAGQQAQGEALRGRVHAAVGGAENFTQMTEWARNNLTPAERAAYNAAVDNGDEAALMLALKGVEAKYIASKGKQPSLVKGDTSGVPSAGFRSTAEISAAINDPRYRTDSAYRQDVERRIKVSSF